MRKVSSHERYEQGPLVFLEDVCSIAITLSLHLSLSKVKREIQMFQVYKLDESVLIKCLHYPYRPTDRVKHHQNTNGRTFESLHEFYKVVYKVLIISQCRSRAYITTL